MKYFSGSGKSGLHERLIELWLDSASERAYQPAFVQMLVGQGHRVLHSTRHGPLEFGKDVITVAPDGVPCAYQLKGNPGGRLNRTQFREIQPQLHELVATAITYPGAPEVHHRSYLVTNGFVEEDVILLIQQMNSTWCRQGFGAQPLKVLSRGDLLAMAQETGTTLWPFSLSGIEGVVALLAHRGDAHLPLLRLDAILSDIYKLELKAELLTEAELERRIPVAALLVSIALRNFAGSSNHYAVASAWALYFTYTVAALEHHGVRRCGEASLSAARDAAFAALGALTAEAVGRDRFVEGQTWTDTEFVPARTALVNALMAVHWLWSRSEGLGPPHADDPGEKLQGGFAEGGLWGEGAIPQLLAHHWYLSASAGREADADRLGSLLSLVVMAQSGQCNLMPLAPPYYGVDDAILHRNCRFLPGVYDPLENDHSSGQSFAAMGLLQLIVQAGAKAKAKAVWPLFTGLVHRSFRPASPWQFCLVRSPQGRDEEVILPPHGEWSELQQLAFDPSLAGVPSRLAADPLMLLLFIIVCPHRMTPDVARYLGRKLGAPPDSGPLVAEPA